MSSGGSTGTCYLGRLVLRWSLTLLRIGGLSKEASDDGSPVCDKSFFLEDPVNRSIRHCYVCDFVADCGHFRFIQDRI